MGKKFIGVMLAAAMAIGLAGCSDSGDTSTSAAIADTQATETQKEEAKNDARKEDGKEGSETLDSEGASNLRIGIITGSVSQSGDDGRGAEAFQTMYGEDTVKLAIYPDNLVEELETIIQTIVDLSNDSKMKAIVMNQSVPGTTEAFCRIKKTRPDILCITGESHENLPEIGSATNLVCNNDFVACGYLVVRTAHKLDCDTFVHIPLPRHMAYRTMSRHVTVIERACRESGMEFVLETTSDPTSDVGAVGAQAYTLEKVLEWTEKHGEDAAYFCTNDIHTRSLLKQFMEYGGYFIEADLPSPLMDYPGALGIDLTAETGDFDKILAKVESIITGRGGADHFGTWVYSCGYTISTDLAQHTLNVLSGEGKLNDIDDITKAYQVFSPKAEWNGFNYTNVETGVKLDNMPLVYQNTYIIGGSGYFMDFTKVEALEKYFTIKQGTY